MHVTRIAPAKTRVYCDKQDEALGFNIAIRWGLLRDVKVRIIDALSEVQHDIEHIAR